ncbi:hypothetical protein ASPZODRAFT_129875 [Penicilliopsis zonata CBS 506.65]|uniref:Inhibitor of growth protein N-terminal histone-binding domain-containing protein n=1 Tax=Penicilliopsis zonata CBS 506.65 TaxID=1073090 RepID=A0A1L9SQS2_9EURO|nr:hypothetical protein ASPZODRAFT_129875 [Penicilliopsis zonata CBS 506.65]OJJ49421.1 hypothetical protein ASPZODRAFT_129875 [Penicilliopsis zonata CBS 506.65]
MSTNSQSQTNRPLARQTRTNPSRTSKTLGRSSFAYAHHGASLDAAPATPPVPHGFYPALTHFTDAITALPREFRRHNSLLKEVDAKAWALEDNLLQLLQVASDAEVVPCPVNPAPILGGVVREDMMKDSHSESQESKNRRLLFDRVRHTLSDLMMTADEKNHVVTNANEELDRQLMRIDSIFPYIAGEVSDEARLGSLTHWAYSNKNTAKTTTNERPRREAASNKDLAHALHEAEAATRSEARREAVQARKQRRTHAVDSDFDDARPATSRKGAATKSRTGANATAATDHHAGDHHAGHHAAGAGATGATKRRKVERPPLVDTGAAAMERTVSGPGTASGRPASKDADATKKRARPAAGASRKRNAPIAESPVLASSPVVGTFNIPRGAASPGPNTVARPSSSRAQQSNLITNPRQRPSPSASNRGLPNKNDNKATSKEGSLKEDTAPVSLADTPRGDLSDETAGVTSATARVSGFVAKMEDYPGDGNPSESIETGEPPQPYPGSPILHTALPTAANGNINGNGNGNGGGTSKGRSSKTSTPVLGSLPELPAPRVRQTRQADPAPTAAAATTTTKRNHKRTGSTVVPPPVASEDEESLHEGDDEDDDGEPRYCYCNEVSFGEMVACDNDACPREWFHLSCVGMTKPPGKNGKSLHSFSLFIDH